MAQESAKNASGTPFNFELPNANGQANRAGSRPVTHATEDLTALTAPFKAEDAAHASADTGAFVLAVRRDTAASGASADGDYASINVDSSGHLWVRIGAMTALPAGTNNIGDVDIASAIPAGTNLIGKVGIDQTTPGTTNGVVIKDSSGNAIDQTATINVAQDVNAMKNGNTSLTPKFAKIAASSSGNNTLIAAVASKKIRVLAYNLMGNGAVNAKFQDGAGGTDLTGLKYIAAAGGGICAPFNPIGWFETTANTLLNLNLSGAVAVGGEIVYVEV